MMTRFALLAAGLTAVLALAPAEASAHGGGRWHGGGPRVGFGVFVGPPAPVYGPRYYGSRYYGPHYGYYGYPRTYGYWAPAYVVPPPAAYYGYGVPAGSAYLPPAGGRDGGYKR